MFTLPYETSGSHSNFELLLRVECIKAIRQTWMLQNARILKQRTHFFTIAEFQADIQRIHLENATNAMQRFSITHRQNLFTHFLFNWIHNWPKIVNQIGNDPFVCFSVLYGSKYRKFIVNTLVIVYVSKATNLLVIACADSLLIMAFKFHNFLPSIWKLPLQ